MIWPTLILSPEAEFNPEFPPEKRRAAALAEGLCAWANCYAGTKIVGGTPDTFGRGVLRLSQIAGLKSATPEAFKQAADEFLATP